MAGPLEIPIAEFVGRLEAIYGSAAPRKSIDPVEELIACVLSQHTTDSASMPAYDRLRQAFPTWESILEAGSVKVADVIRRAGLANQKARTIVACLALIRERTGSFSLDHLAEMEPKDARAWLTQLPGIGPKTASIVLCFSMGMPVVPVDTHVHRVAGRLGLIPKGMGASAAHDLLLEKVPPELAYRFHVVLIEHGRRVCRAQRPSCGSCPLQAECAWYRLASQASRRKPA